MKLSIRRAESDDIPDLVSLIREFAEFEELTQYCEITDERLHAALFGEGSVGEALIVLDGRVPAGYAIFFPNFSSFRGQRGFYLDDIYLKEEYRGTGIGKAILKQIAGIATARGFERIDFQVLDRNTKAVEFYLSLGAVRDDEERHFKFTDEAFRRLAS